ncbi:sigma 54-interacting transcriptional regulator [Bacillus sp. FJAT-47783]|uniref:sigma-54 interaction domain-containing protein n=1 Tax=Bacillus sp. FJAT-47783 TaxID=2922712 RepID=UPI001FAC049B|nr:sigma 54-interacting transcriptional regulator [Bacillus sp. FJAT-47783]
MKRVQKTEKLFFEILDTIDEGIHAVDADGYTIFYNHIAAKHDGMKREEVIDRHLLHVFPSLTEETSTLLKVIHTQKPIYHLPQTYVNVKGEKIETVNTTLPIVVDGELIGAVEIAKDYSKLKSLSEKLLDLQQKKSNELTEIEQTLYHFDDIITTNPTLIKMKEKAKKVAKSPASVLIYGETGAGKELFVQSIHAESLRKQGPFIAQNCAALPESLLESILFGTTKGSYTGATDRAGLFELAHGGTLFLDELQSMPLSLQAKLLRVIEDGYVRRIGSSRSMKVDVRIVAAMNEEPFLCVENGRLREDLFYRLNVFSLAIPPLRERKEDIIVLTKSFIQSFNIKVGKDVHELSTEVKTLFYRHDWPGNVRELKHVIEYAMTMVEGKIILLRHLPDYFQMETKLENGQLSLREEIEHLEKKRINEALQLHNGNVLKASKHLQIPRQTLQYKMKRYEMSAEN